MAETSWQEEVGSRVIMPQIIVGALLAGCITFLVIAAVLVHRDGEQPDAGAAWIMNLVLLFFLAGDMIARVIVPRLMVAKARQQIATGTWSPAGGAAGLEQHAQFIERTGDAGRLLCVYFSRTIVAAALLEGVAFFAIIVYLVTGSMLGLAVAVLMIIALLFHFPTRSGVVHWVEDQLQLIETERQFGSG